MAENKSRRFTGKLWKIIAGAGAVLFWLAVWQIAALKLDSNLILVSPIDAVKRLCGLAAIGDFWWSILFSAGRVLLGFALGLAAGTVLALVSAKVRLVRTLFSPLISAMRSIPVASFTILALIWIGSKNLSVLVSFLICVPIVCANMLEGMDNLDPKLGEMADVFRIPPWRRFVGVYLSQLLPFFRSASRLAIGLCWKSGVAAEVIGIPNGSIGEQLYQSKVYLETADLFAWTITVILLSWLCEKIFMLLVDLLQKRVEKM
ncbi:MAG: ABC transporter permease subunit [Oscillospiraceae bacterium]|nr:ABC transporter permease subunit [Oscillospiraceae bacterium]